MLKPKPLVGITTIHRNLGLRRLGHAVWVHDLALQSTISFHYSVLDFRGVACRRSPPKTRHTNLPLKDNGLESAVIVCPFWGHERTSEEAFHAITSSSVLKPSGQNTEFKSPEAPKNPVNP